MKKPVWIDERDALVLHDRLLALHGGAAGVRDGGLLKPALPATNRWGRCVSCVGHIAGGVSDLRALCTSACARRSIRPESATPRAELPSPCRTAARCGS